MSKFMTLNSEAPATLGAVVAAVTELSTLGEAKLLELVTAGRLAEVFPFKPTKARRLPADTQSEDQLVLASASPLSRKQRDALIESSLPAAAGRRRKTTPKR